MTEPNGPEVSLWRDYERGKVGLEMSDRGRKLLTPDEARSLADDVEPTIDFVPEADQPTLRSFVADLRDFADELDEVSNGDE